MTVKINIDPSEPSHTSLDFQKSGKDQNIWTDVKCKDLLGNQKLITIDGEQSIEAASKVLLAEHISSAPVYDAQKRSYQGFFDYRDLVTYILALFHKRIPENIDDANLQHVFSSAAQGQSVRVKFASDISQNDPFYSVLPDSTLLQAVDIFKTGIYRIAVQSMGGDIEGVLTQSAVTDFIARNVGKFPEMRQTIEQLRLFSAETHVLSVSADTKVIDAFDIMISSKVSSVPILAHNGQIQGSISLSDVKYLLRSYNLSTLFTTCMQFMSFVRSEQALHEHDGKDRYPVFDVSPETTLDMALGKIVATKSHRVWVVDQTNRPIGVVSPTDILRVVAPTEKSE